MHNGKEISEKIRMLMRKSQKLTHEYRFLAGAVYALVEAEKLNHKNRADHVDARHHIDELDDVLDSIGKGTPPPKQWLAGFYYNSAIMRIAASCHRLSQNGPLKGTPIPSRLRDINDEVDELKHRSEGYGASSAQARVNPEDLSNAWNKINMLVNYLADQDESIYRKYSSEPKP